MVSLTVILFSTKCFMFVYIHVYIDLFKLKANKLFENSDADLSWLLFLKKPICLNVVLTLLLEKISLDQLYRIIKIRIVFHRIMSNKNPAIIRKLAKLYMYSIWNWKKSLQLTYWFRLAHSSLRYIVLLMYIYLPNLCEIFFLSYLLMYYC